MIEIITLGQETIQQNGSRLDGIAGHKQKFALLTYIASEGPVSRDRLLGMFWPDRPEERARHSLSQALYALRRELGDEYLQVEGDSISTLDTQLDVNRLERAVEAEDWETVADLYGGPFLEQFALSGAPEFEAWQTATRTRLTRLARRAFPKIIEKRMARGDAREALAVAARWVRLDPLEDEAQHIYITLLAQSGQRTTALEQFENYRNRLARELEVEPLEGTLALVERIRAGMIPEYRPLAEQVAPAPARPARDEAAEPVAPDTAEEEPEPSLLQQLWARRIPHVGLIYLFVVWFGTRLVGDLVFQGRLPDWTLPAAAFLLVLGLPVAMTIAWAHPAKPAAAGSPPRLRFWPRWAERVRGGQVGWFLTGLALVLASLHAVANRAPTVASDRIVVFPFATPPGEDTRGEDIATWIGTSFERNDSIRYIDGWVRLGGADVREYTRRDYRSDAVAAGARFWLQGGVRFNGDSVQVRAEIHDVGGSQVARATTTELRTDDWVRRVGTDIFNQLRPPLLAAAGFSTTGDLRLAHPLTLPTDTPPAADSFLVAEQSYRRLQFGEALRRYESAVAADSNFTIAALKGAMAAGWLREREKASQLIDVAASRSPFLPPSRAEFTRGLRYFYRGESDSAVTALRRTAELAPDWLEARTQLGETYYHLLTSEAPADSLAWEALAGVRSDNPEFYPVLYHLIQIALREGDVVTASGLIEEFNRQEPDSALTRVAANIMFECVSGSPETVDWADHVRNHPAAVYEAAQSLGAGGRQPDCTRFALSAILEHSDEGDTNTRFGALLGLASLLTAEGRATELAQLAERAPSYGGRASARFARNMADVIVLATIAGLDDLREQAADRMAQTRRNIATRTMGNHYVWLAGIWAAANGQPDETERFAAMLRARAAADTGTALDSVLALSLAARAALGRADTATAMELLDDLVPPRKDRLDLYNYPWESRPGEAVMLAELQLRAGDPSAAMRTAASLDSPARPLSDLMYLPHSLVVRVRAARALGDTQLEGELLARLRSLARTDLIDSLSQ